MPHSSRLRRIATWLSLFIVVSSLASWGLSTKYTGAMKKVNVFGNLKESDRPQVTNTDAMTILAVAVDDRSGLTRKQLNELHVGHANYGPPRTDTIMLIHIAPAGGGVTVVSMPRDSWIAIPEYTDTKGNPHAATHDRINTLYQRGGPELMVKTIEQLTNMRIDHFVELNFFGFLNMVDAVGGVPMCISKDVKDTDSGLDLTAGNHVLTGRQALAYVRARHIDSDFGRMQLDDGRWEIKLTYDTNEGGRTATWLFDSKANVISPNDDEAHWLLGEPPVAASRVRDTVTKPTIPVFNKTEEPPTPDNVVSFTKAREERIVEAVEPEPVVEIDDPVDDFTPDELPSDDIVDEEPPEDPSPKPRKGQRKSIPSWDEILFGSPGSDD